MRPWPGWYASSVQTNRIPTEGLKPAPACVVGIMSIVQTNRIPTEGLKQYLVIAISLTFIVQTNRIPTEGLKLVHRQAIIGSTRSPNQQNPDRGIETIIHPTAYVGRDVSPNQQNPDRGIETVLVTDTNILVDRSKPTESRPRD